jgi:predicted component of type VI protein secretion system
MKTFLKSQNILGVLTIIIMTSCAGSRLNETPEQKAAVDNAINNKEFTVAIEVMEPRVTFAVQNVANEILRNTGTQQTRESGWSRI